jgi:hypothetical protein
LEIRFINGAMIALKGADNPESLRGVGLNFLVMDEMEDIAMEAWTAVLRPTLAVSQGRALFLGTPKGYRVLFKLYELGLDPKNRDWKSWQFMTAESPFISKSELEAARQDMDEKLFRQEFLGSFESMSGRVAYAFDQSIHVGSYKFNPELPIWVGQDFNINPMSSVVMQKQPTGEVWVVDEIIRHDSNVMDICDILEKRYWRWLDHLIIYPDPAGSQRQHGRGESSIQIFQDRGFKNVRYFRKAPAIMDRINAANRMLMNAKGEPKLFFDRRAIRTIQAFEQTAYKDGTTEIDKRPGVEHHFDACTYCISYEFPVKRHVLTGISL